MPRASRGPKRAGCTALPDGPLDLARRYLDAFCAGNLSELEPLLALTLSFAGPLHTFDSADAYLKALAADPPAGCGYDLLASFENESAACLVYRFTKPGASTTMAQLFEVADGRIRKMVLVFDTAALRGE